MKSTAASALLFALLPAAIPVTPAFAQEVPPKQTQAPKPAPRKVWTNDELTEVQKPWDKFADQKLAQENAVKAAREKEAKNLAESAKQDKTAPAGPALPSTLEGVQARIAEMREVIQNRTEMLRLKREALSTETDESLRANSNLMIELLIKDIEEGRADLAALEGREKELTGKQATGPKQEPDGKQQPPQPQPAPPKP